jgi:hypothetical protein
MKWVWRVFFWGGLVFLGGIVFGEEQAGLFTSTAAVTEEVEGDVPAETEMGTTSVEKPAWLLRAERIFEEGVLAETAGKTREARKKYERALKIFAGGAEDATLLDMRSEIAAFLHRVAHVQSESEELTLSEPEILPDTSGWGESGDPSRPKEVEMRNARSFLPATTRSTHSYTIRIDPEDPNVKRYIALYTGTLRERTQAAFDRMGRYRQMVDQAIRDENMPREMAYLPVVESEYQTFAVSRAGAEGMWQFMSATAKYAGLKVNYWVDERRDPVKSTRAALRTLKSLYDWFDDWQLALAAYNRGIYGIQRDLEFTRSTDFTSLANRQGIPKETEQYVPKLMALVIVGDNAERYGLRPPIPTTSPSPDAVTLERPLDLKVAAACAGVTESVIRDLNPSLRLWVTPANESHFTLWVPPGSKNRFLEELAKVKDWTPSPGYVRYTVQKGDILGRIATRFRTTASAIQRENKLPNSNRLRPGQKLVIRPGRGFKGE